MTTLAFLPIIHRLQPDNFTCGPTCLAMVFDYFKKDHSYDEIVRLCESVPGSGTKNDLLVMAIESHNLIAKVIQDATLRHLEESFCEKQLVIVNYFNPLSQVGHFALLQGFDGEDIILSDPKNGDGYRIALSHFERLWHNHDRTVYNWMVIVSVNEFFEQKGSL